MRALLGRPQQDYYNYLVQSLPLLYVQGDNSDGGGDGCSKPAPALCAR